MYIPLFPICTATYNFHLSTKPKRLNSIPSIMQDDPHLSHLWTIGVNRISYVQIAEDRTDVLFPQFLHHLEQQIIFSSVKHVVHPNVFFYFIPTLGSFPLLIQIKLRMEIIVNLEAS